MTPDLDEIARLAWVQLWQVTVVALLSGAVVSLCARNRPRLAYALWMLVVVKSIVPPVWSSPTGLFCWALAPAAAARLDFAGEAPGPLMAARAAAPASGSATRAASELDHRPRRDWPLDWARFPLVLFSIWAAGLVLGTVFILGKQIACSSLIRRSSLPVHEEYVTALKDLSRRLGVSRDVRLLVTSRPVGPAVFGMLRSSILLPGPLLSGAPPERVNLILAHELIHVRRGDVIVGKLQIVAQLIWWFHPLVWWANRRACCERERCCDQEVVAGLGCKPALYARTLLSVLEQKGRMRSLVALPGVRALEITSLRLESIMKYAEKDRRVASRISRLVFAAGLVLLVPGMGLSVRARSLGHDDVAGSVVETAPANVAARTMSGVVREKGTGRPVAGVRVNVSAVTDQAGRAPSSAVTDQAGRYTITDLPKAREYALVASPKTGTAFFITSRQIEATDEEGPLTADVEFVRGIPFRLRVLDQETGQPMKGNLSYFPISPNNPFARGVMGYAALASKDSASVGAFYEASPNDEGQFLGAALSGPGFLGFSHPYKPGDESRADRKPLVSYPDGKQNIKLTPANLGGPFANVPSRADPLGWTMLPLGQYDAVIAIDPREGAEVVTYEIRIAADKARE
jgi:beta-lactamase regulating signal transducer with metallopeptidase domain